MSRISIIVISKDDPVGLKRTIASIIEQIQLPKEIIAITKGSSDGVLKTIDCGFNLRVLSQSGGGISSALNLGVEESTGDWLIFLNGGDYFSRSDSLRILANYMDEDFEIITARSLDSTTNIMIPRDIYFYNLKVDYISHQSTLFKKDLFLINGCYKESYKIRMDYEWMLRLHSKYNVKWINEVIVNFQGNGISSTQPLSSCLEECNALFSNGKNIQAIKIFFIMMPFRLLRANYRKLFN